MSRNNSGLAKELFIGMRKYFDDAQIVEIGFAIATLHGMNIFNNMFGIELDENIIISMTGFKEHNAAEYGDKYAEGINDGSHLETS